MSNTGQKVKDEAIRETAFGDITSSFVAIGDPLEHDAFNVTFRNDTDAKIYLSTDGSTSIKKFAEFSDSTYDAKTNDMYRKAGTQFYIKDDGTAATEGAFWIEVEYV